NSCTPISSSSCLIARVRGGWPWKSFPPPRVRLRGSAPGPNYRGGLSSFHPSREPRLPISYLAGQIKPSYRRNHSFIVTDSGEPNDRHHPVHRSRPGGYTDHPAAQAFDDYHGLTEHGHRTHQGLGRS